MDKKKESENGKEKTLVDSSVPFKGSGSTSRSLFDSAAFVFSTCALAHLFLSLFPFFFL